MPKIKKIAVYATTAFLAIALLMILIAGPIESHRLAELRQAKYRQNTSPSPTQPPKPILAPANPASINPNKAIQIFTKPSACSLCHTITGLSSGTIGPPLNQIATDAASRIPNMTAEQYIRQSIIEPNAYSAGTADGLRIDYPDGLMASFTEPLKLTPAEVEMLVEFLMKLK